MSGTMSNTGGYQGTFAAILASRALPAKSIKKAANGHSAWVFGGMQN